MTARTKYSSSSSSSTPPSKLSSFEEIKYESSEKSVFRYIDVDSTYRDRTTYPLPSDFVILYNTSGRRGTLASSVDPVSLGYPFEAGTLTDAGSTTTGVILPALTASTIDDFYINDYIGVTIDGGPNQYRKVTNYTGSSHTAVVSPAYTAAPDVGDPYTIRQQPPIYEGTIQTASTSPPFTAFTTTSSQLVLDSGATPASYVGQFIRITTSAFGAPLFNISRQITSYNLSTNAITVVPDFPSLPIGGFDT